MSTVIEQKNLIAAKKSENSVCGTEVPLAEAIRRWGNAMSITLLDPAVQIFRAPNIPGVIGYKVSAGCAVVFGDPVCANNDTPALAQAFKDFCSKNNLRMIYTAASKNFADWAHGQISEAKIEVGAELVVDLSKDPSSGQEGRMLRKKLKHSASEGVVIEEYGGNDPLVEKEIESVTANWLQGRKGPQIYLSKVNVFEERHGKRWFYAKQNGKLVGVLLLNQLEAKQAWVLYMVMATPTAPNGTSESLVMHAIAKLRGEGCRYLSLGDAQGEKVGEVKGLGVISSWVAKHSFNASKKIFGLDGRRVYWKKYMPESRPSYLLFSHSSVGLREIVGLLRAINVSLS